MPTLRIATALAAGATEPNVMTGSKFEQLPFRAAVAVYATAQGTLTDGEILMDVTMGNSIEGDQLAVPITDATVVGDGGPQRNRHLLASGVANAHDRIQIKLQNLDAVNAGTVVTLIEIRPV